MSSARPRLLLALLAFSPTLIALLWVAGVARFRRFDLTGREWAVVVGCAFLLHVLSRRALRQRPLPPLPAGTSPTLVAVLAATLLAGLAAVVGGVFEAIVEPPQPSEASWLLRTTWHAACAFGGCYCAFLGRLVTTGRAAPGA